MSASPEVRTYDPLKTGRDEVVAIENRGQAAGKTPDQIKDDVQTEVKRAVEDNRSNAKKNRDELDATAQVRTDNGSVVASLSAFFEAARRGLIDPPADPPSQVVFNSLVARLPGHIDRHSAPFIHKIVDGLLHTPNYVQLNPDESLTTAFEQDLRNMFTRFEDDETRKLVEEILIDAVNANVLPGLTEGQVNAKIKAAFKDKQVATVNDDNEFNQQEERYISTLLQNSPEDIKDDVTEFFRSLSNPELFHQYYENKLREVGGDPKEVTRAFQKNLMYIVYTIYSPVLATKGMEFNAAVSASGGSYMQNPNTYFSRLRNKLTYLTERVQQFDPEYDGDDHDNPRYFQVGEEEIDSYHAGEDGMPGRFVRETVPSKDLMPCTFKDFVANMRLTSETLKDLLEVGINAAYLHETGQTEGQRSFYKQKAAYAQHKLPAHRIDELYALPYASFVNAVGKQLDSYLKIQMALNGWTRDPKLVTKIFEKMDTIEEEVLHDLIKHYRSENVPEEERVPEWAILPAILHARTHLIMVSMQPEAIAGYANAAVDNEGNPTYKSQIMANLTVNQTWSDAEQWRATDSLLKGMGFLPQPNRFRKYEDWRPEIVIPEGESVYKDTFRYGKMAAEGRIYFDGDNMPNVQELNPMNYGGVEQQMGWRVRYPYLDWLTDMIDHSQGAEALKTDDPHVYEYAWKRLENIGVHVLKSFREDMLFDNGLLKLDGDQVKGEEQYKNFFKFLYRRYFSDGVGKEGISMSVRGSDLIPKDIAFSEIRDEDDFWNKVVAPIIHRKVQAAEGEEQKDATNRNREERKKDLKDIVHHAMTVIAFERMPTDFLTVENPTRSQNGNTFMDHLLDTFVGSEDVDPSDPEGKYRNQHKVKELMEAIKDISFVEMEVQRRTDEDGKRFVNEQITDDERTHRISPKTLYGRDINALAQDRSQVRGGRGYAVSEADIRDILDVRYRGDNERIEKALAVYREIRTSVVAAPKKIDFREKIPDLNNPVDKSRLKAEMAMRQGIAEATITDDMLNSFLEANPIRLALDINNGNDKNRMKVEIAMKRGIEPKAVTEGMIQEYYPKRKEELTQILQRYQDGMSSRLMWTGDEVFNSTTGLVFHDTIFSALRMANSGGTLISRTIDAVANTQESYKNNLAGGEMLSALSKATREGEAGEVHDVVKEIRKNTKMEDEDKGNWIGLRTTENALNMLRIDSRAENPVVEMDMRIQHRRRSGMSVIVKEGEEHPWRREDRLAYVGEELKMSLIGNKRAKPEEKVYDIVNTREEYWGDKYGSIGERIGKVADMMFGPTAGKYVRRRFKESTGEGLRDREIANIIDIFKYEIPTKFAMALMALMILLTLKGFQDAEEAS